MHEMNLIFPTCTHRSIVTANIKIQKIVFKWIPWLPELGLDISRQTEKHTVSLKIWFPCWHDQMSTYLAIYKLPLLKLIIHKKTIC